MSEPIEVFSMPFDVRTSPYFRLWREALEHYKDQVVMREVPGQSLFQLLVKHPWRTRRHVLCIHWPTALYGSKYALKSILLLCLNIPTLFVLKTLFSFKVVWVLHNRFEHDYPHPWIDSLGRSLVGSVADGLVAQQRITAEEFAALYPRAKVVYIPHSNYGTYFGPLVEKSAALRKRFGFAPGDIILLILGTVRPSKKIENIFEAMRMLLGSLDPRIKLWVVGTGDGEYLKKLKGLAADIPQVVFKDTFIPDNEMTTYAACADYSISYFDESEMTSGVVPLSLSVGLPVIVRNIPGAEQVKNGENGFVFKSVEELADILRALPTAPAPSQKAVAASIAPYTWDSAARRYVVLYSVLWT